MTRRWPRLGLSDVPVAGRVDRDLVDDEADAPVREQVVVGAVERDLPELLQQEPAGQLDTRPVQISSCSGVSLVGAVLAPAGGTLSGAPGADGDEQPARRSRAMAAAPRRSMS